MDQAGAVELLMPALQQAEIMARIWSLVYIWSRINAFKRSS